MIESGKKVLSNKGIQYDITEASGGRIIAKNAAGEEFRLVRAEENSEHIKWLCKQIDMSEYLLKPLDFVADGELWYVKRSTPKGYITLTEYIENAVDFTDVRFKSICDAAVNLIDNFQILHYYNLMYASVDTDDVLVDMKRGQVYFDGCERLQRPRERRLCKTGRLYAGGDTDEVTRMGNDTFAMFYMLFELFYLASPGRVGENGKFEYIFGGRSDFADPDSANAFVYRQLYPDYMNGMFDDIFSGKAVGEVEAKEILLRLKSGIITCGGDCGAENFYADKPLTCWRCGKPIVPVILKIERGGCDTIVLTEGCAISRNDIFHDGVFNRFVGSVVRNPKDKNMFGIKNLLPHAISFTRRDGRTVDLQPNEAAPIARGIVLNYGENVRARIMEAGDDGAEALVVTECRNELLSGYDRALPKAEKAEKKENLPAERKCEIEIKDSGDYTPPQRADKVRQEVKGDAPDRLPCHMLELPKGNAISIFRGLKLQDIADGEDGGTYDA